MPSISEIRQKYPQYNDMSDADFASAFHKKFYSDMPEQDFNAKLGISAPPDPKKQAVDAAKAQRDGYYSSGIYAGAYNPLGTIAKSIDAGASAIQRTPLLGWADEAAAGVNTAGGAIGDYEQARQAALANTQAQTEQNPIASAAGNVAGVVGTAGSIPSLAGNAIANGARLGRVALASGVDGAALGAIGGAGDAEPGSRLENAGYGALGGGVLGAATPVAIASLGSVARRAISPFTTSPEREAAANYLAGEGVQLTAGQRTGSNGLRYAEGEIGGQRAIDMTDRQGEQFTRAALSRAGANADRATPDVIDANFTRIGQQFDELAARNQLQPDPQLAHDMVGAVREYQSLVPESQRVPVVMDLVNDIGTRLSQGPLDGAAYQSARSRIDRLARTSARDPQLQEALYGIRNALDDGMQRTLTRTNPQDLGRWQQARRQYRNMLTLERSATAAGENAAQGIISPSALRNATINTQGRRNYARGNGDFAELARAGEATMKPLPNSGTAGRIRAQNLGSGLASIIGGTSAGYASGGDPLTTAAGFAAGVAAPRIAGRIMMSSTAQAYLSNQLANNINLTPQQRATLLRALGIEESGIAPAVGRAITGQ